MRVPFFILIALAGGTLAACSGKEEQNGPTAFEPRAAQPREDFIDGIGRRFNHADRDHDELLEAADFPRMPDRLRRWDTDGDGTATREEFRAAEIARFDSADTDANRILTGAERVRADWGGTKGKAKN